MFNETYVAITEKSEAQWKMMRVNKVNAYYARYPAPAPLNRRARRAAAALEGRKKAPAAAAKPARRPPVKPGEFDAQAVEDFLRARWFAIEAEMNK